LIDAPTALVDEMAYEQPVFHPALLEWPVVQYVGAEHRDVLRQIVSAGFDIPVEILTIGIRRMVQELATL